MLPVNDLASRPEEGYALLTVRVSVRHNMIGGLNGFRAGAETAIGFARRVRPNTFEAIALFESDWSGRQIDGDAAGEVSMVLLVDHVGAGGPPPRLARTGVGWSALLRLDRGFLIRRGRERPIGEIADALEAQAQEVLAQVLPVPPGPGRGVGRSAQG